VKIFLSYIYNYFFQELEVGRILTVVTITEVVVVIITMEEALIVVEVGDREAPEPEVWEEGSGQGQPLEDCWDTCLVTEALATTLGDTDEAGAGEEVEDITEDTQQVEDHGEDQEQQQRHPQEPGQHLGSVEQEEDNLIMMKCSVML